MTITSYRVTGDGRRVELSPREVVEADSPSYNPLTWPRCQCPRCRAEPSPAQRSLSPGEGQLASLSVDVDSVQLLGDRTIGCPASRDESAASGGRTVEPVTEEGS
ncbi:hypothetical protein P3T37_005567 [Kitasatospora sp. MAA4]|nr:hypothetical protein [Kitasatospora sp. MAA4]